MLPLINCWVCFTLNGIVFDPYVKEAQGICLDHCIDGERKLSIRDHASKSISNSKEVEGDEEGSCSRENELLHEGKKMDVGEGELQLIQSILHNNQNIGNVPCLENSFLWNVELKDYNGLA